MKDVSLVTHSGNVAEGKPKRLPVVVTRGEAKAVLRQVKGDKWLMGMLMYGGGLRLMVCLRLRVQDIDFSRNEILVRDEQEPDMRCGTSGASGHVTVESSIGSMGVLYKSGAYAQKVLGLIPGGLSCVLPVVGLREDQSTLSAWEKSAEGVVGGVKQTAGKDRRDKLGTRPAYPKSRRR